MDTTVTGSSQKGSCSDEYINMENITVGELDWLLSDSEEEAKLLENNSFIGSETLISESDDDSDMKMVIIMRLNA